MKSGVRNLIIVTVAISAVAAGVLVTNQPTQNAKKTVNSTSEKRIASPSSLITNREAYGGQTITVMGNIVKIQETFYVVSTSKDSPDKKSNTAIKLIITKNDIDVSKYSDNASGPHKVTGTFTAPKGKTPYITVTAIN